MESLQHQLNSIKQIVGNRSQDITPLPYTSQPGRTFDFYGHMYGLERIGTERQDRKLVKKPGFLEGQPAGSDLPGGKEKKGEPLAGVLHSPRSCFLIRAYGRRRCSVEKCYH